MPDIAMDTVTAVAIGVLATVFVGSLVALIIVCRQKLCKKGRDLLSSQMQDVNPDVNLVENMEGVHRENQSGVELDDVQFSPNIEEILCNEDWVNDATGLAPHTLAILKTCHQLTEKLVGMTMGSPQQVPTAETLSEMVVVARGISPRVDDVVKAMYPPLDPRLLEARCSSLILQVKHLVLVTKSTCRLSGVLDWVDRSLSDIEHHLKILRDASSAYEASIEQAETEAQVLEQDPNSSSQANPHESSVV